MRSSRNSPLAREFCLVYVVLIVYATLHPWTGWRDSGLSPWAWLSKWPRATLPFDLGLNAAAYVPFGASVVLALAARWRLLLAVPAAVVLGVFLSAGLESLQTYLPSRTPSLADLAANAVGTLAGALVAAIGLKWVGGGAITDAAGGWIDPAPVAARALILAVLWLFAVLYPESLLFGHGSLITWLGPVTGYPFTPAEFVRVETAVTGASLFAAGALVACALAPSAPRLFLVLAFVLVACLVRTLSQVVLFPPEHALAWMTPGALRGLGGGALALLLVFFLPRAMLLTLAAIAVTFCTVVVNFAPPNPYYAATVQELNPGRFLNFNGLTQLVSATWPFLVLLWVPFALAGAGRGRR